MLRSRPVFRLTRPSIRTVAAAAAVTAAAVAGAADAVAATITDITWTAGPASTTAVVISTDEPLIDGEFRTYPLLDPPRAVVLISGISQPFQPASMAVGDGNVTRVRLGHHDDRSPPELHVVFDLAAGHVEVLELARDGRHLRVLLGPAGATHESVRALSSPLPTATPASPPERVVPSSEGSSPDEPDDPDGQPDAAPAAPAPFPTPSTFAPGGNATCVVELAATPRGDGSTLLRVTADGPLPEGCARVLAAASDPPRVVVTLLRLSAPDLPRTIVFDDPNLERVRLVHSAETADGELHLVLHLSSDTVEVTDLNQVGPNLVLRLASRSQSTTAP